MPVVRSQDRQESKRLARYIEGTSTCLHDCLALTRGSAELPSEIAGLQGRGTLRPGYQLIHQRDQLPQGGAVHGGGSSGGELHLDT